MHVQILKVDAVADGPRGVVQEPDRDRDDLPAFLHYVREHRGRRAEKSLAQVVRRRLYRVRFSFVLREQTDTVQASVFVAAACPPQDSTPLSELCSSTGTKLPSASSAKPRGGLAVDRDGEEVGGLQAGPVTADRDGRMCQANGQRLRVIGRD
jgi:hypothetical protein